MANETMIHEGQSAHDWAAQADPQISVTNGGVQGRSDFAATPPLLNNALRSDELEDCELAALVRYRLEHPAPLVMVPLDEL